MPNTSDGNAACQEEVIVRKQDGVGWRVEVPHAQDGRKKFTAVVPDKKHALQLAAQMCPGLPIRVLFAPE